MKESAENARSDATAAFEGIQAGVQPILDADNPELQSALSSAILGADLTDPQALLGLLLGGFGGGVDESVFGHAFDVNPGPPPTITDRGNLVDPNTIVITVLTDPNLTIVVIDSSTEEEKVRDVTIAGGPNEIDATVHTRSSTDADTGDFLADVMIHYADAITDPVDAALTIDGKVDFGQQGQKLLVKAPVNISLDLYREATAYLAHVMGLLDVSVLVTLKSDFSKITVKPTIIAYISASDSTGSSLPIFTLTGKGNAQLKGLAEDLSFATASLSFSTVSSGGKFFARGTPAGTLKAALKNRVKLANASLEDLLQLFQFTGKAEIRYRDKAQPPTLFFELTP